MIESHTPQVDPSSRLDLSQRIEAAVLDLLRERIQPSARELVTHLEEAIGLSMRFNLMNVLRRLAQCGDLTQANRDYLRSLIDSDDLSNALQSSIPEQPAYEVTSSIDHLVQQSKAYRSNEAFQEMIDFMARFRDYAPYNNMLVRIQNPSCGFFATAKDWRGRFGRDLIEDARPMLILAPMHPVMLVYDVDQTQGGDVPQEQQFPQILKGFVRG